MPPRPPAASGSSATCDRSTTPAASSALTPAPCATCHEGPLFTDNKPHRIGPTPFGDPADLGEVNHDGHSIGFDTPALIGLRFTAPYFHQGSGGVEGGPTGPAVARQALRTVVLPFYNARFQLRFTDADLDDLTEFLLSL